VLSRRMWRGYSCRAACSIPRSWRPEPLPGEVRSTGVAVFRSPMIGWDGHVALDGPG
jgi:hypothetical protein